MPALTIWMLFAPHSLLGGISLDTDQKSLSPAWERDLAIILNVKRQQAGKRPWLVHLARGGGFASWHWGQSVTFVYRLRSLLSSICLFLAGADSKPARAGYGRSPPRLPCGANCESPLVCPDTSLARVAATIAIEWSPPTEAAISWRLSRIGLLLPTINW